ncbi:TPA: GLPGLI family protein [Elizabethkingia meningoseptica]|uniref:GLPGLI family protein n=1 Tax=Elizabethkingia meningoseptica TaxID=238 RepID=UPI0022F188CC|nr:GLPGLI family protein [Elizabethkingia meningoseptica]EJK5328292.1 GLPGLI family protein [Elizabethkingia meningoseptica]WBS76152.1 GLPGLI family protein [Elizabethkingia meningoseptica]HAY3561999.1 GLPGLI family protein [Elizabethkingia meningoseptica]
MLKFIFIFFCFSSLFGQSIRFVYKYSHLTDSLKPDSKTEEVTYLDVSPKGSFYYKYEEYKRDSTLQNFRKKNSFLSQKTHYRTFIEKQYANPVTDMYTVLTDTYYKIREERAIKWNVLEEKTVYEGYHVQKASTVFAGRKWIAWFSNEIPISDGPYKFCGLPGLILKISDDKGQHIMELVKTVDTFIMFEKSDQQYINIPAKKYSEMYEENVKDPLGWLRKRGTDPNAINKVFVNGQEVNATDFFKNSKMIRFQKEDNPIELTKN